MTVENSLTPSTSASGKNRLILKGEGDPQGNIVLNFDNHRQTKPGEGTMKMGKGKKMRGWVERNFVC